jgi:hypothetical protein
MGIRVFYGGEVRIVRDIAGGGGGWVSREVERVPVQYAADFAIHFECN